jgi:hypothetical protein
MCATEMSPTRPGRPRWFVRFLRALLVTAVTVAALYGVTTVVLGRRYEAELNRIKQRGEPVTMADLAKLAGEPVPDSENAAIAYQRIFKKLKGPAADKLVEALDRINPRDETKKTPQVWAAAESAARQFDPIVPMAEEAAAMPRCLFHVDWEAGCAATFEHFQGLRNLARVLADKSVIYAHEGEAGKALHCAELALGLGERAKRDPILVSALVRMALINFSSRATAEIVRQCPIIPAQAKRLYDAFGAVDLARQSHIAWLGERAWGIWAFNGILRDGWSTWEKLVPEKDVPPRFVYGHKPVIYADANNYLSYMGKQARMSDTPFRLTSPDGRDTDLVVSRLPSYAYLTKLLVPGYGAFRRSRDRCQAEINIARAGLALVAYKDKFGSYPASLDDVTKKLGWAPLPEDPFSGKALVYKPQAKGFIVYSIGPNLKDDGGKPRGLKEDEEKKGDIVISRAK